MAEKKWELLQSLTASFEQVLAPGAVIKSPDHILDKDTGELREVDVSIREQVGSVPVLITVECRDRAKTEDSRWIEELAEKKRAIGAHATIAVSTCGFSKPAQRKAERCGIQLRHVGSIRDAKVELWFQRLFVTVGYLTYEISGVGMDWPDDKKPLQIPDKPEVKLEDAWTSPIFRVGPNREGVSAEDLLEGEWNAIQPANVAIGKKEQKVVGITPNLGIDLYFRYEGKDFALRRVELILQICNFRERLVVENLRQYAKGGKILAFGGLVKLTTGLNEPIDFVVLKRPDSNRITVTAGNAPWWKRKQKKRKER